MVLLANLCRNLLAGAVSSILASILAERQSERDALMSCLGADTGAEVNILPHPAVLRQFEERLGKILEALNDPAMRSEAAETIRSSINRVTIEVEDGEVVAELEASTASLIDFAQKRRRFPLLSRRGPSCILVAGTGFEPVTFRL